MYQRINSKYKPVRFKTFFKLCFDKCVMTLCYFVYFSSFGEAGGPREQVFIAEQLPRCKQWK